MDWKKKEEFQILPSRVVQMILEEKNHVKEGWIELTVLFPQEYRAYLLKVLNSNRHHPLFSYNYIRNRSLTEADLYRILRRQLCCLTREGHPCFEKVRLVKIGRRCFLYLRYQS